LFHDTPEGDIRHGFSIFAGAPRLGPDGCPDCRRGRVGVDINLDPIA
jgi:hypothetical protein